MSRVYAIGETEAYMPARATFFASVFVVFLLLGLLVAGFKVSAASAAQVGSSPRLPDLNGDGVIDMHDVATCARAFYSHSVDPNWNSAADLNYDGVVDMRDIAIIVKAFGKNCRGYDFDGLSDWNVSSGDWSVQNGTLEGSSSNGGLIYAGNSTWENCVLTARLQFAGDSAYKEAALAFCVADSGNFYYAGLGCWGHRLSISKCVDNAWQELAFSGDIANVYRGLWYVLSVKASGGTIMLYLNGSLELSVNDSALARGFVGARIWNSHVIIDYVTVIGTRVPRDESVHDVLYADGTKLRAPSGEEVVLRGTQIDYNVLSRGIWFGPEDVENIKAHGGNAIELHVLWFSDMMPQRGVIDQNWISQLDKWVSWCEQEQVYSIISFANFEWRDGEVPTWFWQGKYPGFMNDKNVAFQASIDFWDLDNPLQDDNRQSFVDAFRFLAERYRNDAYMLFGIVNEPFAGNELVTSQNADHLSIMYARFIERIVDAVRSAGARQLIFIDRPYCWDLADHSEPVNRDGIVWEDHLYVTPSFDLDQWKARLGELVQLYVDTLGRPFYVGEYGAYPFSEYNNSLSDWRTILKEQVTSLKSVPVCGYSWHEYPVLEGEYYDYVYNYFTSDDSEYILQTIFG